MLAPTRQREEPWSPADGNPNSSDRAGCADRGGCCLSTSTRTRVQAGPMEIAEWAAASMATVLPMAATSRSTSITHSPPSPNLAQAIPKRWASRRGLSHPRGAAEAIGSKSTPTHCRANLVHKRTGHGILVRSAAVLLGTSCKELQMCAPTRPGERCCGVLPSDQYEEAMQQIVVPFVMRGRAGEITVSLVPNPDPLDWMDPASRAETEPWDRNWVSRFPTCTAVISHPAAGYDAMCGWVQLVRSSDSIPDLFEMDPTPITAGLDLPYCWFGTKPTLFDAPNRDSHADLDWRSRSFLAASPHAMSKTVVPIAAFEWGFDVRYGSVIIAAPTAIPLSTWDEHILHMKSCHPSWTFETSSAQTTL